MKISAKLLLVTSALMAFSNLAYADDLSFGGALTTGDDLTLADDPTDPTTANDNAPADDGAPAGGLVAGDVLAPAGSSGDICTGDTCDFTIKTTNYVVADLSSGNFSYFFLTSEPYTVDGYDDTFYNVTLTAPGSGVVYTSGVANTNPKPDANTIIDVCLSNGYNCGTTIGFSGGPITGLGNPFYNSDGQPITSSNDVDWQGNNIPCDDGSTPDLMTGQCP